MGANMNANRFGPYGAMGPYGMGYGGLGYGLGYGGLGYGVGYPFFGMYGLGGLGMMGMGMGGMGYGGGYGGGGYGGGTSGGYATNAPVDAPQTAAAPTDEQIAQASSFDAKGEADFIAGNYQAAVQDWQHALIDTPHSGGDMLLLAQALFATGQYQPAAGAVQLGMQMLPPDQWGNVLKHYAELYPTGTAFTDQLRGLEAARTARPDDPAIRFLLGYEYGYLGYAKQAVAELDKGIALQPKDRGAVMMRNQFAAAAGVPEMPLPALPAAPGVPATQPTSTKVSTN
jgi:tetratricopeptide (TPR) repeat protein